MIDDSIEKVRVEFMDELTNGLADRERTGKERFDINSKAIEDNTRAIAELTVLVKDQVTKLDTYTENVNVLTKSMTALNTVVKATAESQRNSNYDRLLVVFNKVLASKNISVTDKTNLKQLYNSWKELGGDDPKIDTMYEACENLNLVMDD